MVKIYVQTPLKFWFHIKFSREYDYVNEYPYSAKLQNMTCWTKSDTQSSHIKGLDKCVWCWVCSVLSKQRGEVVWWGGVVRFTKANCGQESQWPYTDCGPAVTGMFASWVISSIISFISGVVGSIDFFLAHSHVSSKVEWLPKNLGAISTAKQFVGQFLFFVCVVTKGVDLQFHLLTLTFWTMTALETFLTMDRQVAWEIILSH